jgi:hypothetical protein
MISVQIAGQFRFAILSLGMAIGKDLAMPNGAKAPQVPYLTLVWDADTQESAIVYANASASNSASAHLVCFSQRPDDEMVLHAIQWIVSTAQTREFTKTDLPLGHWSTPDHRMSWALEFYGTAQAPEIMRAALAASRFNAQIRTGNSWNKGTATRIREVAIFAFPPGSIRGK